MSVDLGKYSEDDLQQELERRRRVRLSNRIISDTYFVRNNIENILGHDSKNINGITYISFTIKESMEEFSKREMLIEGDD